MRHPPGRTRRVLSQILPAAAAGIAAGTGAALLLSEALAAFLFEIGTTDPVAYPASALLLLALATLAVWIPARRAARVDPVRVLAEE